MKSVFLLLFTLVVASQGLLAKDSGPFSGTWTGIESKKPGRYIVIIWGKSDFRVISLITDSKPDTSGTVAPLGSTWRGKYTVHGSVITMDHIIGSKTYPAKLRWSVAEGFLLLQSEDGERTMFLTRAAPGPYLD